MSDPERTRLEEALGDAAGYVQAVATLVLNGDRDAAARMVQDSSVDPQVALLVACEFAAYIHRAWCTVLRTDIEEGWQALLADAAQWRYGPRQEGQGEEGP